MSTSGPVCAAAVTRLARGLRAEGGFTVIEMLVSMTVLGVFFAVFATVVSSSIRHGSEIQEEAVLQTEVRASVDTLAADLRQATAGGDTTLAPVSQATGTQLTFLSPDRAAQMHLRLISFQVTGGQLQRALATSTNTACALVDPGAQCLVDGRPLDRHDGHSRVHLLRRRRCLDERRRERQDGQDPRHGRDADDSDASVHVRHAGHAEAGIVRRMMDRLRREDGVALVLVVFGVALLATLSVILVDTVTSESARSAKSVKRQSSFEAAESGLDDYIAKLADDRAYYLHWVHPAESTRQDDGSGGTSALVSPSGSSPAPSTWCRDTGNIKQRPAPVAWAYGATWNNNPNGKDHWCDLGNGYEFNLQITPPSASQLGVKIVSTGRKIGNPADTRIIEAVVRQSSITDFQEIADQSIGWAAGATSYGLIYSNQNITWNGGTAYGNNYAVGTVSGSVTWQNGATGFDGNGSTAYQNLFAPPSPLTQPIDFNNFLTSFSDIASAAGDATGGGIYLDSSYASWRLTFNSDGTVKVEGCTDGLIEKRTTSPTSPICVTVAPSPRLVPTNGAIYSEVSVVVQGTVKGRVTVATPNMIIIGGNLLYAGDAGFTGPVNGQNVLGLEAMNEVVVPCWINGDLDWRAALLSENETWGALGNGFVPGESCTNSGISGNLMRHRGSSTLSRGGSFSGWFDNRDYLYDDSLQYLPPPWFPTLDPDYKIVSFRELPAG